MIINPASNKIPSGNAFPATPTAGNVFFRTDLVSLYYYDGAAWQIISPAASCNFYVYRLAAKTLTASSFTDIAHDTKIFDLGNNVNTTTGIFTAPRTGKYAFHAVSWVNNAVAAGKTLGLRLMNGTGASELVRGGSFQTAVAGSVHGAELNALNYPLTAGDTVKVQMFDNDSGTGLNLLVGVGSQYQVFEGYQVS